MGRSKAASGSPGTNRIDLTGNGGTICCILHTGNTDWQIRCKKESMQRIQEWSKDPVMQKMLEIVSLVPNVLVPKRIPRRSAKSYSVRPNVQKKAWFCAGELSDYQSLQKNNGITVNELWTVAANLSQTLSLLYSLGIWGNAGRGSVILQKLKKADLKYLLTGITDFHIYRYEQLFCKPYCADEDPVTTGMRLLIGGVALCADLDGEESGYSTLEKQIGAACINNLSAFFRNPSSLSPSLFLETAERELRQAAENLQMETPKEICLYLVVLGSDCRRTAIPALSSLTRSFYHCVQELGPRQNTKNRVVCVYPWDTVHISGSDEGRIYGLSALHRNQDRGRHVLLGGLLDCLNRELERAVQQGIAALVCYITLPAAESDPTLTCMDIVLFRELAQKHQTELCEAFICSADLQQKADPRYSRLNLSEKEVSLDALDSTMYAAVRRLLSIPCFSFRRATAAANGEEVIE